MTLSDRTQTIRASVEDVQFTLLLTIALVVMVIFVFLRSLWATIIPSVTVPLALLGTCALMWLVRLQPRQLSLMALTIAVGFVVDDAIVVLENIAATSKRATAIEAASRARRDRLHDRLDQRLAGGGVYSVPADGRHHRPALSRIRGHGLDDDRGLGRRCR